MKIESNGVVFHCQIEGQGPWLMLSHGLATDLSMWDETTEALKDRYRVLRYDARGHGDTPAMPGDYTLSMLVADAAGILRQLGIEQAHFCGLSMGGMVGLGLMIDHPGLLRSAVIADSRHTTRPDFTEAWLLRAEAVRTGGIEAIVQSTVDRWSSEGLAERRPDIIDRMKRMVRRTTEQGYRGCAAALARLNYGPRLGEVSIPTLLICGSEDHGAPPENTRQMHDMIGNSRFVEIGEAGHISNIEQPARFNAAVREFLRELDGWSGP